MRRHESVGAPLGVGAKASSTGRSVPEDEPDPSAEVTAAPGKLPRLGKKDLEQLVEPFERLGCHLPKHIEKPEAQIACDQHTWRPGAGSCSACCRIGGPLQPARVFVSRPLVSTTDQVRECPLRPG